MSSNSPWVSVAKPISVWNKPVQMDFKEFFKAISKTVIHGAVGKWDEAATDTIDALGAVGLESDAGQLAWLLIRRAMSHAALDLVKENANLLASKAPPNPNEFCDTLDFSLENAEITIDKTFFEQPLNIPIIDLFKKPYKQWFLGYGLTEAQADTIIARLPSYFVYALNNEWRRRPEVYAPIKDSIETPFTKAGEREQGWALYASWLQKQINESVFNETFSLKQIYVPLRAYYSREKKDPDHGLSETKDSEQIAIELETELDAWVNHADPRDAIRVINGDPGSGKSSFTRMYAAHQATTNSQIKVLYIPLHQFDPKDDLISGVYDFVRLTKLLPHNPLDPDNNERILIIFDGLDELSMQGKIGAETARDFIDEVDRTVNKRNIQQLRLQVLMTGRPVVVQANTSKFRKEAQIFHVLPYFLTEEEQKQYIDPQSLLNIDQRHIWWQRYANATGRKYQEMPQELQRDDLQEITTQPLLNYLVALSFVRGELDFTAQVNLNEIYEDLLKAVYKRDYAGGRHMSVRDLPFEHFIRVLEEIGLATWHGDGRTTTIHEVYNQCKIANLSSLLEVFQEGAEAGVARLLTAFYFRQHDGGNREGERTFEFTHKSFGEYLTARRIVRSIEKIHKEITRRTSSIDEGWDERMSLKHWAELYGDAPPMTQDLFRFVSSEVSLRDNVVVTEWQKTLSSLIGWMLRYGMPMELLEPRPRYQKEMLAAIRAEESLLALLYASASVTGQMSQIDWPSETSAGTWLARLQGQRTGPENGLVLHCLGFLNLQGCILYIRDFYDANLIFTDLSKSQLSFANFSQANLEGANLERSNLSAINFERANLRGTNLRGASFFNTNLSRVRLERANLRDAKLEGANLKDAELEGTYLPDGTVWAHDTDMERFTKPQHPNFWQPEDNRSRIVRRTKG